MLNEIMVGGAFLAKNAASGRTAAADDGATARADDSRLRRELALAGQSIADGVAGDAGAAAARQLQLKPGAGSALVDGLSIPKTEGRPGIGLSGAGARRAESNHDVGLASGISNPLLAPEPPAATVDPTLFYAGSTAALAAVGAGMVAKWGYRETNTRIQRQGLAADGAIHAVVMSAGTYLIHEYLPGGQVGRTAAAVAIPLAVGLAKELTDLHFGWDDMAVDVAAVLATALLHDVIKKNGITISAPQRGVGAVIGLRIPL
ncbi:MAG: hypothetical protein HY903_23460 [Deltaproteobacteria bacterium]|nr:hypothetical protein [Deltaproteobacteria bacterium]